MMKKICACLLSILMAAGLFAGCTDQNESAADEGQLTLSDFDKVVRIPLIRQGTTYSCGVAAMHSLLRWASYDLDINDEYLMEDCGTTPENGTSYQSIMDYMNGTGLLDVTWQEEMTSDDIKAVTDEGGVVILPIQAWDYHETESGEIEYFDGEDYIDHWSAGHWAIACGCSDSRVLFMDPSTAGTYTQMTWTDLEYRWHDSADYVDDQTPFTGVDHCGMIVYKTGGEEYDPEAVMPLM